MKYAGIVLQGVLLLGLVSCAVLDALDALQIVHSWPAFDEAVPKITLFLVALLGSSFLIEHWTSIENIRRNTEGTATTTARMSASLHSVAQLTQPTRLVKDRRDDYMSFLRALDAAPQNANVDVTHFEKLLAVGYDVGENDTEGYFMSRWRAKVLNGDIEVRQIVHVSSLHDVREVEQRIGEFKDCLNFSLNVSYVPLTFPILDLVIIHEHWAMINFSIDATQPFYDAAGIETMNPTIAEAISEYFDLWWSKFSVPVKTRNGTDREVLQRLKCLMPETSVAGQGELFSEFALLEHKEPLVRRLAAELVQTASHFHVPAIRAAYASAYETIVLETVRSLHELFSRSRPLERPLVEAMLVEATVSTVTDLLAVSYDTDQGIFWNSPFGQRLFDANREAAQRAKITRIFALTRREYGNDSVLDLLRRQHRAGVEVYYTCVDDIEGQVGFEVRRDFMVVDEKFAFELTNAPGDEATRHGTVYLLPREVQERRQNFRHLQLKSTKFQINQRRL